MRGRELDIEPEATSGVEPVSQETETTDAEVYAALPERVRRVVDLLATVLVRVVDDRREEDAP
jgi:hypothetical protein